MPHHTGDRPRLGLYRVPSDIRCGRRERVPSSASSAPDSRYSSFLSPCPQVLLSLVPCGNVCSDDYEEILFGRTDDVSISLLNPLAMHYYYHSESAYSPRPAPPLITWSPLSTTDTARAKPREGHRHGSASAASAWVISSFPVMYRAGICPAY